MPKKELPEAVRRWYQRIGAMGGRSGKGKPERIELMRQNAHIRWNKYRKAKAAEKAELKKILAGAPEMPEVGFR